MKIKTHKYFNVLNNSIKLNYYFCFQNQYAILMKDNFESPDYYLLDELLTSEHLLIRKTIRDFVKKEISPIIEEVCQSCVFPKEILPILKDKFKIKEAA